MRKKFLNLFYLYFPLCFSIKKIAKKTDLFEFFRVFFSKNSEVSKRKRHSLYLCLLCFFCVSWKWKDFSIKLDQATDLKVETAWLIDTVSKGGLRKNLVNNSPPLLYDKFVIQGNAIDGIKAYDKETGRLIWDFYIPSGVSSSLVLHKGNIYFGGADGFFYSLQLESGLLNWKYFSGGENGPPLIFDNRIYWLSSDKKVYALDIKGSLLWIYSDSSFSKSLLVKGLSRPAVYKNNLYVGFQTGVLTALNRKTGQFKWKRSFSQPIIEDLKVKGKCLLAPVFNSHLFCLDRFNGKTLYQLKGGSSVQWGSSGELYQLSEGWLYVFQDRKLKWKKELKMAYSFPPALVKNYLIYGSSSKGDIIFLQSNNGKYKGKKHFGKGLAGPPTVQGNNIYFLSTSAYLHKLKIK